MDGERLEILLRRLSIKLLEITLQTKWCSEKICWISLELPSHRSFLHKTKNISLSSQWKQFWDLKDLVTSIRSKLSRNQVDLLETPISLMDSFSRKLSLLDARRDLKMQSNFINHKFILSYFINWWNLESWLLTPLWIMTRLRSTELKSRLRAWIRLLRSKLQRRKKWRKKLTKF